MRHGHRSFTVRQKCCLSIKESMREGGMFSIRGKIPRNTPLPKKSELEKRVAALIGRARSGSFTREDGRAFTGW
jgi:hypothetical protein